MAEEYSHGYLKFFSFLTSRLVETAVWTFAELGIADILAAADTPQTANEIAEKQGWNSDRLYRLLRTVADTNIVHEIISDETIQPENTNHFELTDDGRFFVSSHPSKLRFAFCWANGSLVKKASHYLPELIRGTSNKRNGLQYVIGDQAVFQYLHTEGHEHEAMYFNEAMASSSICNGPHIVNAVDFSRFNTIVDIGGGTGSLLAEILKAYPTIKHGICFELPKVIEKIGNDNVFEKQNIAKDRYEYMVGDMFDSKTIPQAEAYTLKHIIHDWDDDRAIDILKAIRTAANGKQITIFIIEIAILPETEENQLINRSARAFDLHMMLVLNAKERSQYQYEYLCKQSGFQLKNLYRTKTSLSIIEAVVD